MGAFADALAAEPATRGPRCSIGRLLAELDKETRTELDAALADERLQSTVICRALTKLGHQVSDFALQRHRRGGCTCPKPMRADG